MLVDAAKLGDVEIPVFCYEPKLGNAGRRLPHVPGRDRGHPQAPDRLLDAGQGRHGRHTQTERVKDAQRSVVEFLLINHPLDCPVCDKGGECPLQDISFGWGGGISRFIEPKRHFVKPLELSPLIAIDRERCILCYRCVRFSQEVAEDYQLVLLERGAHSFVGTFDGHPYVAPFSGNIIELCPVGALTSRPYRFRARPWDIEDAGTVCTLCPAQCNVTLTVRDERVLRVLARDNAEVDDGWLCDKGRFAYQALARRRADHRAAGARRRELRAGRRWERALDRGRGAGAQRRAGARSDRRDRRRRGDQRGGLPAGAAACARRSARRTWTRARDGALAASCSARSATRACRRASPTSSSPTPCWCSAASRSTTRRSSTCACARACAATALKLAVASATRSTSPAAHRRARTLVAALAAGAQAATSWHALAPTAELALHRCCAAERGGGATS